MTATIDRLARMCADPTKHDVETAGHCFQCKPELGTPGVVCVHCSEAREWPPCSPHTTRAPCLCACPVGRSSHVQSHGASERECGSFPTPQADPIMERAERCLFGRQFEQAMPGRHMKAADVGTGRTNPSSAETALRALSAFASRADGGGADADARAAAKAHLEVLEASRREFTKARALLVAQRQTLSARDELEMANSSFRLRAQHEIPPPGALRRLFSLSSLVSDHFLFRGASRQRIGAHLGTAEAGAF